ncbi:MAG: SUF system Fe-S cluster assembly protein [Myxococcota bacterium]|jgi:FeS assembly SUF system protein
MALKERISGLMGKRSEDSEAPEEAPEAEAVEEVGVPTPEERPHPGATDAAQPGEALRDRVIEVLKTVYDPEIPVDIYELGLIYDIDIRTDSDAYIRMTLTSPMCPVAETLPPEVEAKVRDVEGIGNVELDLVWDPPWNPDMMSEAAKLTLNF